MIKTNEIALTSTKYTKKMSVIAVADSQGNDFKYVLKSVYEQTLDKSDYEVIILVKKGTNVSKDIINGYADIHKDNTSIIDTKHVCLGNITESISRKKIKPKGEYITIIRGSNTFYKDTLINFTRMNGGILALDFAYPNLEVNDHNIFNEINISKKKVFLERKSGIHKGIEMTTSDTTEFCKAFHIKMFDKWVKIPHGENGTSLVFYSMMLSMTEEVFYYSVPGGILRNNIGFLKMSKEVLDHFLEDLKFLEKNLYDSPFIDKLILLRLYYIVKTNGDAVPKVVFDIDFDRIKHDEYNSVFLSLIRKLKIKRDKKGIETIRELLGDRINPITKK